MFLGSSWLWSRGGAASWPLQETGPVTAGDDVLLQYLRQRSREFLASLEGLCRLEGGTAG